MNELGTFKRLPSNSFLVAVQDHFRQAAEGYAGAGTVVCLAVIVGLILVVWYYFTNTDRLADETKDILDRSRSKLSHGMIHSELLDQINERFQLETPAKAKQKRRKAIVQKGSAPYLYLSLHDRLPEHITEELSAAQKSRPKLKEPTEHYENQHSSLERLLKQQYLKQQQQKQLSEGADYISMGEMSRVPVGGWKQEGPEIQRDAFVAADHPNYHTLAGIEGEIFDDGKQSSRRYREVEPDNEQYQTLAGITREVFDRGEVVEADNPNYHTLAGIEGGIFDESKEESRRHREVAADDANYHTLAAISGNTRIFDERGRVVPAEQPNYQTLAGINADIFDETPREIQQRSTA